MNKSIHIFHSIDELSRFFGQMLADQSLEVPEGEFFSVALSGGSSPRAVFQTLASNFKKQISWEKIRFFWGDERCVPPDDNESNYRMAQENLLSQLPIPDENIFRIKGEDEPEEEAKRYTNIVRQNLASKNNIPCFDLVLLGLGTDGHTASIFPGHIHLFKSNPLFEVAEHPQSKQKRITASGQLINNARTVAFLATGKSKSAMVANILEKNKGWEKLPAAMVNPQQGQLLWMLDDQAASELKQDYPH